jgi:hypothetical protein
METVVVAVPEGTRDGEVLARSSAAFEDLRPENSFLTKQL